MARVRKHIQGTVVIEHTSTITTGILTFTASLCVNGWKLLEEKLEIPYSNDPVDINELVTILQVYQKSLVNSILWKKKTLRQNFAVYAATVNHNHITGNLVTVHFLDQDGNVLATATKHVPKSVNIHATVNELLDQLGLNNE